jgi:hypothetical protein
VKQWDICFPIVAKMGLKIIVQKPHIVVGKVTQQWPITALLQKIYKTQKLPRFTLVRNDLAMWREEHIWNNSVPQRVQLSNPFNSLACKVLS